MIIATAGHVDHGKTTLLQALTGTNADRLAEEKRRGMTIDLGYAYGGLYGQDFAFVDVPGHEKFIRNMLAGVTGADAVLLVVAADDGIMPQTREHLEVIDLLGLKRGVVALTKADLADDERQDKVIGDIRAELASTGLRDAEVIPVSAPAGLNLDLLTEALRDCIENGEPVNGENPFRMPVDRVFTLDGAGLVVTGSARSGRISRGDEVVLQPSGRTARVRSLRAQNKPAEQAGSGERIALNISGIDKETISRGDWIVSAGLNLTGDRIDIRLVVPGGSDRPFRNWTSVEMCHGAESRRARVAVLEGQRIEPGSSGFAQVVLDEPLHSMNGDRLILRDAAGKHTLAGGSVIDPCGPARGRSRPERLELLRIMEAGNTEAAYATALKQTRSGLDGAAFLQRFNPAPEEVRRILASVEAVELSTGRLDLQRWTDITGEIIRLLEQHHHDNPEEPGLSRAALSPTGRRNNLDGPAFEALIAAMVADQKLKRLGPALALPAHRPVLPPKEAGLWKQLRPILEDAGLRPPRVREIAAEIGTDVKSTEKFLKRCAATGRLMRVADNRYFTPASLIELGKIARELHEASGGQFTASEFKDRSGIGRNLTIELLEFFDRAGLTRRSGQVRKVIARPEDVFDIAS